MTGVTEINNDYTQKTLNTIAKNPELYGFYAYLVSSGKTATTICNYIYSATNLLKLANKEPNDLVLEDFIAYIQKCTMKDNGERYTTSYTIEQYHGIKNYGEYLAATKVLTENPVKYIKRPRSIETQETINKREKGFLTREEMQEVVANIKKEQNKHIYTSGKKIKSSFQNRDLAIIMIFLTTGIRCSALIKMDVDDVIIQDHIICITEKGQKVKRCQLNDNTWNVLYEWMTEREIFLQNKKILENGLFITFQGKRIKYDGITEIVKKYSTTINGKHITPHKLRATYGTQLYEATKDIYFVQKAMGHSSPTTTERYIRGQNDVTKEASDIMGNLF